VPCEDKCRSSVRAGLRGPEGGGEFQTRDARGIMAELVVPRASETRDDKEGEISRIVGRFSSLTDEVGRSSL
jgi:hypothetical protein